MAHARSWADFGPPLPPAVSEECSTGGVPEHGGAIPRASRDPHRASVSDMVGVGAGFSRRLLGTALLVVMSACSHGGPGGSPPEPGGEPSPGSVSLPSPGVDQPRWKTPPAAYLAERNRCIDRE